MSRAEQSPSKETRKRMSEAQKRRAARGNMEFHKPEARAKVRIAITGRKLPEELKKRLSVRTKEYFSSHPEAGSCIADSNRRRNVSAKTRAKMSAQRKGRPIPPKVREAARVANIGRKYIMTEEWKRSISFAAPRKHSSEHNAAMARGLREHAKLNLPNCRCVVHGSFLGPTIIEKILVDVLLTEFPEVKIQEKFGPYKVDAYLPFPYHLAFEADGTYWHQNKKKDVQRDEYLFDHFGLPVVRLSEEELRMVSREKSKICL